MVANTLIATELKSRSGVMLVDGDLQISHNQRRGIPPMAPGTNPYAVPPPATPPTPQAPAPAPGVQSVSFVAENIVVGGVRQWKLVRHDDFEPDTGGAQGWSLLQTSSCARNQQHAAVDHFLGGHCNIGNGRVTKTFRHLPPHSQVRDLFFIYLFIFLSLRLLCYKEKTKHKKHTVSGCVRCE